MKYSSLDLGTVEAVFNKLGGLEGARAFLRGEQKLAPSQFERNEHGHIVFTFDSFDFLTGEQEVERLIAAGFRVSDWAKSCLTSKMSDGYDKNHRLIAGQYQIALMPTREIERDSDRTTDALRKRGIEKYGYEEPLAGIMPRIRESVSDKQMEEMGFSYIAGPHDPIKDSGGDPRVLGADRDGGGRWLYANWDRPGCRWDDGGAFAFFVPAS